jgi:hypothetical protein
VAIPLSDRVPGRASGPSQSRVDDGGGSRCVSGKLIGYLGFSRRGGGEGSLLVKGHRQKWTEAVPHIGGAARGWVAPPWCEATS